MYEEYYHLNKRPFALGPDPKVFFKSEGHKKAISYLRYGLKQREGLIVISGEIGTGKTLLVKTIAKALESAEVISAQIVSTQIGADDLLRLVCKEFGLTTDDKPKANLLVDLENFLLSKVKNGQRVLLLIDEAQNLPRDSLEELRMLSNFEYQGRALIQTFLLGQKELIQQSLVAEGMEQVRQRIIASYHLGPLSVEETGHYIEYRLDQSGWMGDPEFSDDMYPRIHEYTGGIPRKINKLCDRMMLFGSLEELHFFDLRVLESVIEELDAEFKLEESPERDVSARLDPINFSEARFDLKIASLEKSIRNLEHNMIEQFLELRGRVEAVSRDKDDKANRS